MCFYAGHLLLYNEVGYDEIFKIIDVSQMS